MIGGRARLRLWPRSFFSRKFLAAKTRHWAQEISIPPNAKRLRSQLAKSNLDPRGLQFTARGLDGRPTSGPSWLPILAAKICTAPSEGEIYVIGRAGNCAAGPALMALASLARLAGPTTWTSSTTTGRAKPRRLSQKARRPPGVAFNEPERPAGLACNNSWSSLSAGR